MDLISPSDFDIWISLRGFWLNEELIYIIGFSENFCSNIWGFFFYFFSIYQQMNNKGQSLSFTRNYIDPAGSIVEPNYEWPNNPFGTHWPRYYVYICIHITPQGLDVIHLMSMRLIISFEINLISRSLYEIISNVFIL